MPAAAAVKVAVSPMFRNTDCGLWVTIRAFAALQVSKKLSVLLAPLVVRTILETTEGVPGGVLVTAPAVVEVCPRWLTGGVSVTV